MMEILNRDCECWGQTVSLNFANRDFPKEAVRHIYCPRCSKGIQKKEDCMQEENGWLIEYDPNLLRPVSASVRLIQKRREPISFLVYVERGRSIGGIRHLRS